MEDLNEQEEKRRSERESKMKKIYYTCVVVIAAILCVLSYEYAKSDISSLSFFNKANASNFVKFNVPYGAGTRQIAENLVDAGVIKSRLAFRVVSKIYGYDGRYQAGMHIISKDYSYAQIMNALSTKSVCTRVTIPEGSCYRQIVDMLVSKGVVNEQEFVRALNEEYFDYSFLDDVRGKDMWIEGYLFPDTYEFMATESAKDVINKMLSNFDKKFEKEYYTRAKRMNMTISEVVTLASIVEKEAKIVSDRRKIVGVFYNRLASKELRRLQSCATVQYILYNKYGVIKQVLSKDDTLIDSPYNTYVHEGLPVGPICCPGKASIEAVLYPEKNDYYYFVAKRDGEHIFSRTYEEHLAAIQRIN